MSSRTIGLAVVAMLAVACGGSSGEDYPAAATPAAAPDPAQEEIVLAKLSAADLADGTEDHVIERCPGCGLAMPGSADHALEVDGYQLHFCSDSCQGHFAENTTQALLALDVPEPESE